MKVQDNHHSNRFKEITKALTEFMGISWRKCQLIDNSIMVGAKDILIASVTLCISNSFRLDALDMNMRPFTMFENTFQRFPISPNAYP